MVSLTRAGRGWTGPTRCKDSICVRLDEWYSQCQPPNLSTTQQQPTTTQQPGWSFTRPPRTWPGQTTTKQGSNPVPTSGFGQLYDQCGGKTWTGVTQCAPGLICAVQNEYFSICQKPSKKRSAKFGLWRWKE